MAEYPDTDMGVSLAVAFGADLTASPDTWTWTDLSGRLIANPITVSQGVLVGTGTSKTASANGIVALNDDGYLTPYLATSPYWPYVDVGTPATLSIQPNTTPYLTDTFTRTVASGWGTPDTGPVWQATTGLSVAGGKGLLALAAANTFRRTFIADTHRDLDITFDISVPAIATGATLFYGPQIRDDAVGGSYLWPGIEFGLAGVVRVAYYTGVAGVPTLTHADSTAVTYSAASVVSCRVEIIGDRLRVKAWTGSQPQTWQLDQQVNTLFHRAATHLFMAALASSGNSNTYPLTFSLDNLTVQQPTYPRIEGYLTGVQPTFRQLPDGSTHSVVQISIGGIGSRLERRVADELSPLRRSLEKADIPPIAYWPLEDKSGATSGASAFPNQPAMVVTGPAVFAFDLGLTEDRLISGFGTTALVSLAAGAKLTGTVPATTGTAWVVSAQLQTFTASIGGGVTEMRILEWRTPTGTHQRWALVGTLTGHVVRAYNDVAGTSVDVITFANGFNALFHHSIEARQNGGNIDVRLLFVSNPYASGSVAGTIGMPSGEIRGNPDQVNTTASTSPFGIRFVAGHVTVHNQLTTVLPSYIDDGVGTRADQGWGFESATARAVRLADEEQAPLTLLGDPSSTGLTRLNTQQPGAFTDLLKQAIDSESGGLIYEGGFGYVVDPRSNRYNRAAALTIDMDTYRYTGGTNPEEVLVPKLDARGPNVWTVERTNGSAATYSADSTYLERRGEVRAKATLDVLYDADTAQHAAFRTHLSVDGQGANYPTTTIDLAANPDLIDDWLLCVIGSRMQRTNQPTVAGLGVIDQIIDGISETYTPRSSGAPGWIATCDTSPAEVWDTGLYDDTDQRYDSRSTTLVSGVTDSATKLGLSTVLKGDIWTITSSPFGIEVAGQTNTVLWMSGVGSISLLEGGFETGLTGWQVGGGTSTIGASGTFAHAGVASCQLTVAGSPTTVTISNTTQWPAVAATAYTGTAWIYSVAGISNVRVAISWYQAAGTFISSSNGPTVAIPAATWTQLTVSGTSPALTGLARIVPTLLSSPANGTVVYLDDLDITLDSVASGAGPYTQNTWVTRDPVVVKALSANEPVHVATPGRWAL